MRDVTEGPQEHLGLIPRTLDYLFELIAKKQNAAGILQEGSLQYTCM
jgi:hypothetical protein